MTIVDELEALIARTSSYNDRELLTRVLEQLKKKNSVSSSWGFIEDRRIVRK